MAAPVAIIGIGRIAVVDESSVNTFIKAHGGNIVARIVLNILLRDMYDQPMISDIQLLLCLADRLRQRETGLVVIVNLDAIADIFRRAQAGGQPAVCAIL